MNATSNNTDPFSHLSGLFRDDAAVTAHFEAIAARCHLISPSSTCPALPPGYGVSFNVIKIDATLEAHSVGGGKLSLLKTGLLRLADAAGICWVKSERCDDGRHPYVVHWHEVGVREALDGQLLTVTGDYQLDLRDGTAASEEILANVKAFDKELEDRRYGRALVQLRKVRAKILERAQTGARLRGVRDALKLRSYTAQELDRPFVVARAIYLGHDDNKAFELENKRAIRARALGGVRSLFGAALGPEAHGATALPPASDGDIVDALPEAAPRAKALPAAPPPPAPPQTAAAPQVSPASREWTPEGQEAGGSSPRTETAGPSPARGAVPATRPTPSSAVMKFGRAKGVLIIEAEDRDLEWYAGAVERSVHDPSKAKFRASNEAHLAEVRAELARRAPDGGQGEAVYQGDAGQGDDDIPF